MILKGKQYIAHRFTNEFLPAQKAPKDLPLDADQARLCTGALLVRSAFQEMMNAVTASSCPKAAPASRSPAPRRPALRPTVRPEVVEPLEVPHGERKKWEIEAALDFAFSEMAPPPRQATADEIAATLDSALPDEACPAPRRAPALCAEEVFVIPYEFELRCLLSAGHGKVHPNWVPSSMRPATGQEEKKN
jgi:hypothetical protein